LVELRGTSQDLTHYLDDLRAGFREIEPAEDSATR
jgi:hypothetical protein